MNYFIWSPEHLLNLAPKNLNMIHLGYGHLGVFVPHYVVNCVGLRSKVSKEVWFTINASLLVVLVCPTLLVPADPARLPQYSASLFVAFETLTPWSTICSDWCPQARHKEICLA